MEPENLNDSSNPSEEGVVLPTDADSAFALIMDTLAPEEFAEEVPSDDQEAAPATGGTGLPEPQNQGTVSDTSDVAAPNTGAAGEPSVAPAATGIDAATLEPEWAKLSSALETRQQKEMEDAALAEVRAEHVKYFEALQQHPRMLVGESVPSLKGEGTEILRDSQDAREWQDALKQVLVKEVKDRVQRKVDDVKPMMESLHASIDIFRNNPDLIPGSAQFDRELADQFAALVKPYELRIDDKLVGYSVPIQGFITQLRQQMNARRTATPAAPAAPAAPSVRQQQAAAQTRNSAGQFHNPDAPQAGIPSSAGNSGPEGEDFSTLFSAYGLPNLKI